MEQSHFYLARDLLTKQKKSEMARLFSQSMSHFKLYRNAQTFHQVVEYLRKGESYIVNNIKQDQLTAFYDELRFWGLSFPASATQQHLIESVTNKMPMD